MTLKLDETALAEYLCLWNIEIEAHIVFLYMQRFENTELSSQLTQLELPNIMSYLQGLMTDLIAGKVKAEFVVENLARVEQLVEFLRHSQVLTQVVAWREQAALGLEKWSNTLFQNELLKIDRLLQQGDLEGVHHASISLLRRCERVTEKAYTGADHDLAVANYYLGQALLMKGSPEEALTYLHEARQIFEGLGVIGTRMVAVSLARIGDCMLNLKRIDDAVNNYKKAVQQSEKMGDKRQVAAVLMQLSQAFLLQDNSVRALVGFNKALSLFERLDEPSGVAMVLHQIGKACHDKKRYEEAEQSYRRALSIECQLGNQLNEAKGLLQIGLLYKDWDRPLNAVDFYQQSVKLSSDLGDLKEEGFGRSNLAEVLIQLQDYDTARYEVVLAIKCLKSFGSSAEPWKAWGVLHCIETMSGNTRAALSARQMAIDLYLARRRNGGENYSVVRRICHALTEAIRREDTVEIGEIIEQNRHAQAWQQHTKFLSILQAILAGSRDMVMTQDENLSYDCVVELTLALENLNSQ